MRSSLEMYLCCASTKLSFCVSNDSIVFTLCPRTRPPQASLRALVAEREARIAALQEALGAREAKGAAWRRAVTEMEDKVGRGT